MAEIYRVDEHIDRKFFKGAACAFGVFDGVHTGHRFLLAQAQESALRSGGVSIALTFDIDPDEVFHAERLKKLMSNEDRLRMLASTGVDVVAVLPFTTAFSALRPEEFLEATFDGTPPAFLHVGYDFKFGARAAGSVRELELWGSKTGTAIVAHDLKSDDGAPVTATRIRLLLAGGGIAEANRLLSRPYSVTGIVEAGRGQGADFGFRTANLTVSEGLRALGEGVYAAWVTVNGARYRAAVSVGVAPTFANQTTSTCEVHLLDFDGDLYGRPITVEFIQWLRPMREFASIDELIATVQGNITWVRENL